jgi:hypothetical protein
VGTAIYVTSPSPYVPCPSIQDTVSFATRPNDFSPTHGDEIEQVSTEVVQPGDVLEDVDRGLIDREREGTFASYVRARP